jgi:hypothetical protein
MASKSNANGAATPPAVVRCAIYTRKSTEEGLNQEFNSLDAQRDSGEAYIRSQAGEGWALIPDQYDDGGFTGANMERPAVRRLLADVQAKKVDCVVVYKVDRLSRSIRDFAKMMEILEKSGATFVSVTQQFNTTTSLGRLTLNILLSFAQFEREIISERTCDKQSRKGPQSTCTFFRPERTDLVVYDAVNNELRISTSTIGEMRLYREKFGKYVFGDPERFVYSQKYTLAPLKAVGTAALYCRDIGGIEWVHLTEIEYAWPGAFGHIEKHKADDVFKALELTRRKIESGAKLQHARFAVKLAGETNPRPVVIRPPNIAEYGRGEEAAVIEQWLRARRFVLVGSAADDETSQPFVAVA